MPVEFISSTNFGPSYSALDPGYARRYIRMLDDGYGWTLCGYDARRVDSVTRAHFVLAHSERVRPPSRIDRGSSFRRSSPRRSTAGHPVVLSPDSRLAPTHV